MDEVVLKRVQQAELYLLVSFDRVCREKGLTYFLDSGTALGAVRHGGFIPWDDDVDVGMPRKDYEKFMEIGQSLLPPDIFLQNSRTEINYRRYAAKLRLEGTVFPETDILPYAHNGLFIDIFPFDNIPRNKVIARFMIKTVVEMNHVVWAYRYEGDGKSPSRFRRVFSRFIKRIPSGWIDRLERFSQSYARRYENKDTGCMTCFYWRMTQTKQYLFESKQMFPVKDTLFNGCTVMIMNNPDYYLKLMYGDYMQLPPVDQRKVHHRSDVDLGVYESLIEQ